MDGCWQHNNSSTNVLRKKWAFSNLNFYYASKNEPMDNYFATWYLLFFLSIISHSSSTNLTKFPLSLSLSLINHSIFFPVLSTINIEFNITRYFQISIEMFLLQRQIDIDIDMIWSSSIGNCVLHIRWQSWFSYIQQCHSFFFHSTLLYYKWWIS